MKKLLLIATATVLAAALALALGSDRAAAGSSPPTAADAEASTALFDDLLTGLAAGDTPAYISELERRVAKGAQAADPYALLGLAYQQLARETGDPSNYTRAADAYDNAQRLDPDHPVAAIGQASLSVVRHQFARGVELAERALELAPDNATAYAVLGDGLLELGRYQQAFAAIERAAELSPTPGTYARVANARELVGRPQAALAAARQALSLGRDVPEHRAWTLVESGNIARRAGKTTRARQLYRTALREVPGYVHARAALAALLAARGDHDEAVRRYRDITTLLPLPAYFVALAKSLEALGLEERAEAAYDRAGEIIDAQTANGVKTELARAELLLTRGGDTRLALNLARRGVAAAPNTEAEATLAWALLENGQFARARAHSKQALRLGTHNIVGFRHRSEIESCLGNTQAAATWLARAAA